ncbi:vegetative incompatibility protein HET-E-1 [Aspergillus udagawae]|nr:vegetative incompatibility protein HET-E-1 [Aspergillus udagawae]
MEGPIANASKLKPEIRLAQALADFKAVLSTDRRARFDESIAAFKDHPPDANDVNRLTAEINRDIQQTTRRCYGPRFVHVLQAVQQYASIGDVLIGGSQNLVASGVWAAVRLALTMLTQSASYLEKMSTLFMNAGRSAPRYQDMALLYPRSKRLRDALCEYFIVILNICKHAVKFLQKSALSQLSSAISDSSLASFEKALQQWSIAIVEEVALLSSQSFQEEAKENSRFRQIMAKFSDSSNQRQQLALRIRLLDACTTYDYQTSWKQARKQGTTTWFESTSEFQQWKGTASSCSLLCTGKLGSGKTTLLANMVDDLFFSTPKGTTAYFFCRFDVTESLTARIIIGCLARQLLGQQPIDLLKLDNFCENWLANPDEQVILNFVRELLPPGPIYNLIVDGFDECLETERRTTLEILQQLQKHFKIRICLSFRQDAADHAKVAACILNGKWTLLIPENNPDIEAYIDAELHERLESDRLCIGDPAIILLIQHALVTGAQGMFLWATLLLDCICMEQTDEAILLALESLPQSLSETFRRILQQADASNIRHRHRVVQLVMAARRPLSVQELSEALGVIPEDTTWEPGRQINNIHAALASCKCLIITDEEEQTVRFAHHSVKQFFIAQGGEPQSLNPVNPDEANKEMGRIILTYLNYGLFDRQVSRAVFPSISAEDAPARIVSTVFGGTGNTKRIALELLKARKIGKCDIGQTLAERAMTQGRFSAQSHPFLAYAKNYYMYHILGVWNYEKEMGRLWQCLLASKSLDLRITGWLQYELQQRRVTGLDGEFVPCDVLSQLVTYDVIRKVLEETGFYGYGASKLAHGILTDRQRWFAILVDIGINDYIGALFHIQSPLTDRHLPISRVRFLEKYKSKVSQTTVPPAVQSGSNKPSTSRSLAPILQEGQHYDSEDGIMPFLRYIDTFYTWGDKSVFVQVHPAHYDFPPAYCGAENVDGNYQVALSPWHLGEPPPFLLSLGRSWGVPWHLLQAVASYRPRGQDGTPQPICLISPILGPNLDVVWQNLAVFWQQTLDTSSSRRFLRFCLSQMTGIAEALAYVIQNDPEERYISLLKITPRSIQWCNYLRPTWGTLRLDLRTLIADQSKLPVRLRQSEKTYHAPYDGEAGDVQKSHCVWSLGCIYFEFLIWAVMGATNREEFHEARGGADAPFYSKTSSDNYQGFELSPEVSRWAAMLLNEPELPPEVPRFTEYLLQHVLVVDPSARVSARQLASDLENIQKAQIISNLDGDW